MRRARQRRRSRFLTIVLPLLIGLEIVRRVVFVLRWRRRDTALINRVRRFNRRWLNPTVLRFAGRRGSPYAVVHHIGRRSGKSFATPVVAARIAGGFVIPLAYSDAVDWYLNMLAAGSCMIEWQGETYRVGAPTPIAAEAALPTFPALWRPSLRLYNITRFIRVMETPTPAERPAPEPERMWAGT